MTFEESIYDFLRDGGKIEDYLTEVQNAANAAQARIQEESNKKAADDAKLAAADALAQSFTTFITTFYPNVKIKNNIAGADLIQVFDAVLPFTQFFKGGFNINVSDSKNDPIETFLNTFVR